jgi:hypothetical protein
MCPEHGLSERQGVHPKQVRRPLPRHVWPGGHVRRCEPHSDMQLPAGHIWQSIRAMQTSAAYVMQSRNYSAVSIGRRYGVFPFALAFAEFAICLRLRCMCTYVYVLELSAFVSV